MDLQTLTEKELFLLDTLSVNDFCRKTGMSEIALNQMIQNDGFPVVKIAGKTYVNIDQAKQWAAGRDMEKVWNKISMPRRPYIRNARPFEKLAPGEDIFQVIKYGGHSDSEDRD